jgi:hypothetical protein
MEGVKATAEPFGPERSGRQSQAEPNGARLTVYNNGGINMPIINYLAVFVAGVAGWLVGAVWYGVLGKQWMAALGWTEADCAGPDGKRHMPIGPMIIAFVAQIIMALMLAGILGHMGAPNITNGIISGVLVWFGFVITTITVNNAFQKRSPMLTAIDGGHWLVVLVVQGIVLGLFG